MKRIGLLMLIAILCFAAIPTQAQIGKIKNAVDKAKNEEKNKDTNSANNSTNSSTTRENKSQNTDGSTTSALNADGTMKSPAQLGFDPKYPPGFMYSTLLNGINMRGDGTLYFDDIRATFLPPASSEKRSYLPYNNDDGGKLTSVIRNSSGKVIDERFWNGKKIDGPVWEIRTYALNGGQTAEVKLTPGEYTIEFYVEGKPFYRFPFSVVKEGAISDAPFAKGAGDKFILEGAWNKYGYLYLDQAKEENPLIFKTWLRLPVKNIRVRYVIELLDGNGKLIGKKENRSMGLLPYWERKQFGFNKPSGSEIIGYDILRKDGNYEIKLSVEGKHYGTYPFSVKDGKFVLIPEQRRGEAPFMTMIEGGNDAWFVKKSN